MDVGWRGVAAGRSKRRVSAFVQLQFVDITSARRFAVVSETAGARLLVAMRVANPKLVRVVRRSTCKRAATAPSCGH